MWSKYQTPKERTSWTGFSLKAYSRGTLSLIAALPVTCQTFFFPDLYNYRKCCCFSFSLVRRVDCQRLALSSNHRLEQLCLSLSHLVSSSFNRGTQSNSSIRSRALLSSISLVPKVIPLTFSSCERVKILSIYFHFIVAGEPKSSHSLWKRLSIFGQLSCVGILLVKKTTSRNQSWKGSAQQLNLASDWRTKPDIVSIALPLVHCWG